MEAGRMEELEGGGQEEIEDDLRQDQGQQHGRLVEGRPVHWQHLSPLEYSSEIFNININIILTSSTKAN